MTLLAQLSSMQPCPVGACWLRLCGKELFIDTVTLLQYGLMCNKIITFNRGHFELSIAHTFRELTFRDI